MARGDDFPTFLARLRSDVDFILRMGASRWSSPNEVAFVKNAGASQTGITTAADLTGLSVTWTRDATRRYRYSFTLVAQQVTTGATFNIILAEGAGAGTTLTQPGATCAANAFFIVTAYYEGSGTGGSVTHHLRGTTGAGSLSILNGASNPSFLSIDDIGPA